MSVFEESRRGRLNGLIATRDALAKAIDSMTPKDGEEVAVCFECGGAMMVDPSKMAMFVRQLADVLQQIEDLAPGTGQSRTDAMADELARRRAARSAM